MRSFLHKTLERHSLRHTNCREDVLSLFSTVDFALTHSDLEGNLQEKYDRVTLYRTLKTFVDKGILHKVLDGEGLRYALCKEACSDHGHQHDHVHFKCSDCGKTTCLDNIHIPHFTLPKDFVSQEISLLIQGICANCK
jgi:Fur family transcriptional regulator, ferric uptake regulator